MYHYQGPNNPTPLVTHDHDGIPYKEAVKRMEAIDMALAADMEWLTKIIPGDDDDPPVEWSGYMNYMAREKGFISKSTRYIYGPLIDAPPSHPDTVQLDLRGQLDEGLRTRGHFECFL